MSLKGWLRKKEDRRKLLEKARETGRTFVRGSKRIYKASKKAYKKADKYGKKLDKATKSKRWKAMGKTFEEGSRRTETFLGSLEPKPQKRKRRDDDWDDVFA